MDKIGAYRIVRQLGQGGMGVVYEAMNDQISRRVAIKVLHKEVSDNPELLARFFNEARASNLASHASIVDVYELGQLPDGRAYIVMQFLAGDSLADRLQHRGGKLPVPDAIRLIRQVASGMAAAHNKGIIHRDLKPDNVMIVEDSESPGGERAKIVDFGIAKMLAAEEEPGAHRRTRAGTVLGTPAYMSPEQCRGAEGISAKADVYALGVMLYECLAGRTPFSATGTGEMLAKHIYEPPPPLWELDATLPAELVSLVHAMLHKQPESRPAMVEVVARLTALGAPATTEHPLVPSQAAQVSPPPPPPLPPPLPIFRQTEALSPSTPSSLSDVRSPSGPRASALPSQPRRWRWWHLGTLLAGLLALSGGGLFVRTKGTHAGPGTGVGTAKSVEPGAPSAGPAKGAETGEKPAPTVHWSITTHPAGAQVVDVVSQQSLGVTPLELDRPPTPGLRVLALRLPGYQEHSLRLLENRSEIRRVSLAPLEPVSIPAPEPGPKRAKPPRTGKTAKAPKPAPVPAVMTDDDVKVVQ